MSKIGFAEDPTFPHIPLKCGTKPESACSGCPSAALAGHETARVMYAEEAATADELVDLDQVRHYQQRVKRMAYDPMGVGNDNQVAANAKQFAYFSLWTVVSVGGGTDYNELVLATGDPDPAEVLWYNAETVHEINPSITIDGYVYHTAVQPWDMIVFLNSVLSVEPVITQILGCGTASGLAANEIKVKVDKSCKAALTPLDPLDTSPIQLQIFNFGATIENWDYVITPDVFLGERKIVSVASSAVSTDGVYLLEVTDPVMHPGGFNPLQPTWVFEGRSGTNPWESVAQADDRLFVLPDKAYVCFKTTKPAEGVSGLTLSDDLTSLYTEFRITYYKRVYGGSNCGVVGYGRCKWSVPDTSQSAGNYKGLTAGTAHQGRSISTNGTHFVCLKRIVDLHTEPVDTDSDGWEDSVTNYPDVPSGVLRFPVSGQCSQHGCCNYWTPAEGDSGRDAPTSYSSLARNLDDIWGAVDLKQHSPPLSTDPPIIYRVAHPSIANHAGYVVLENSPNVTNGIVGFLNYGNWGTPYTYTDPVTGDESLHMINGLFELYNPGDFDSGGTGLLPTLVTGWNPKRDPLDASVTYSQDELERIGFATERDTGAKSGFGMSNSQSFALPPQNIVLPNFDADLMDTVQTRTMGSFERKSAGANAIVKIFPIRQEEKGEILLGSRELALAPEDLGGGLIKLTFTNETHTHTSTSGGSDIIDSWLGGGVYPICPTLLQEINDYNEPNKTTGSRLRGAWRGDALGFGDRRMVIESVTPHGGDSAGDWGGAFTPSDSFCIGRHYTSFGQNQDIAIVYDNADGTVANLTVGAVVNFYKLGCVQMPGAILEWCEYGTNTWAAVDIDKAYYGDGTYEILDSWFTGKPAQICFRLSGCKLLDHRGGISAPVWNKTSLALDALQQYVKTTMGGAIGGFVGIGKSDTVVWDFVIDGETGCKPGTTYVSDSYSVAGYTTDGVRFSRGNFFDEYSGAWNTLYVGYSASGALGLPPVLRRVPEGTVLLQAFAEVNCEGLVRQHKHYISATYNCDGSVAEAASGDPNYVYTIEDLSYGFVGFTSPTDYSEIGSIPGAANGTRVLDVTDIINAMYESRDDPEYPYGFGLLVVPETTGLSVDAEPGSAPSIIGECNPCGFSPMFNEYEETNISWTTLSISTLILKLQYPNEDKIRTIIVPRFPSMKDLPSI